MRFQTLYWQGSINGTLVLLDQRKLPLENMEIPCEDIETVFDCIKTLAVRGAPAIGVAAAYGLCVHMRNVADDEDLTQAIKFLKDGAKYLSTSRPTAVNLFWALNRMLKSVDDFISSYPTIKTKDLKKFLLNEAVKIDREDKEMCRMIGQNGLHLIKPGSRVLTHCNAGALATAGIGTALAPLYEAKKAGVSFKVYADETRPLLQGARLTAWELAQNDIDVIVICDNMAGWLMANEMIDLVIVGADRIAKNGDTANKIGTYSLSVLAKEHGVPFYVAAPKSTFDLSIDSGKEIPIEQRDESEIKTFMNVKTAPQEVMAFNPAFDVTPARNITAIITENGVIENLNEKNIISFIK